MHVNKYHKNTQYTVFILSVISLAGHKDSWNCALSLKVTALRRNNYIIQTWASGNMFHAIHHHHLPLSNVDYMYMAIVYLSCGINAWVGALSASINVYYDLYISVHVTLNTNARKGAICKIYFNFLVSSKYINKCVIHTYPAGIHEKQCGACIL